MAEKLKLTHDDLGLLLIGNEKLTITKIRLVDGIISFEAEGECMNDYHESITGVTILDPQRNVVHSESEYVVPKLQTVLKGDRLHMIFNLDPNLKPTIERWTRAT